MISSSRGKWALERDVDGGISDGGIIPGLGVIVELGVNVVGAFGVSVIGAFGVSVIGEFGGSVIVGGNGTLSSFNNTPITIPNPIINGIIICTSMAFE